MNRLIICALYLLSTVICFSQGTPKQPTKFDPHKLEFGGNFGLSLGNNATTIIIAPQVGYAFNPRLSAGIGVNYSYYKYSTDSHYSTSLNYLGFNVYGRLKPINPLVLQIQPEIYNMWGSSGGSQLSQLVPSLLCGAGVIVPLGNRGGIMMMLYYDLVQNNYSPYGNRLFYSIGYAVAL